jgi:hypothetical protein
MSDPEESREEWEKEIIDVQHSVTFPEELRSAQIIAKNLSASPAPIQDFSHLVRLFLSGILLVVGFVVFSSDIPHKIALGVAAMAASCFLGSTAFRWARKRG